jgi:DNA-binding transcriptional LysR family regulator
MTQRRPYKEVSIPQLRSFCETARLESFKAAAAALGLAHPTVWEQVHALQRYFGVPLVEPHGRGCRLTADGRALAGMIGPLVADLDSIKRRFLESRRLATQRLTIATTPRTLVEDLPEIVAEFEREQPQIQISLKEVDTMQVAAIVEAKEADLGLTVDRRAEARSPWLAFEPCYALDLMLLTRRDHPLAKVKRVLPAQLKKYPLVNGIGTIPDPAIQATLDKLRLFETEPRRIEARNNDVIRRYVKLGFGIGLVVGRPGAAENRGLHERTLSQHFGQFQVNAVSRRGSESPAVASFVAIVRKRMG